MVFSESVITKLVLLWSRKLTEEQKMQSEDNLDGMIKIAEYVLENQLGLSVFNHVQIQKENGTTILEITYYLKMIWWPCQKPHTLLKYLLTTFYDQAFNFQYKLCFHTCLQLGLSQASKRFV